MIFSKSHFTFSSKSSGLRFSNPAELPLILHNIASQTEDTANPDPEGLPLSYLKEGWNLSP
jgi:hypothetical protein